MIAGVNWYVYGVNMLYLFISGNGFLLYCSVRQIEREYATRDPSQSLGLEEAVEALFLSFTMLNVKSIVAKRSCQK